MFQQSKILIFAIFFLILTYSSAAQANQRKTVDEFSLVEAEENYPKFPWKSFIKALQSGELNSDIATIKI